MMSGSAWDTSPGHQRGTQQEVPNTRAPATVAVAPRAGPVVITVVGDRWRPRSSSVRWGVTAISYSGGTCAMPYIPFLARAGARAPATPQDVEDGAVSLGPDCSDRNVSTATIPPAPGRVLWTFRRVFVRYHKISGVQTGTRSLTTPVWNPSPSLDFNRCLDNVRCSYNNANHRKESPV